MERRESGRLANQQFERTSLAALNILARLRSDSVRPLDRAEPHVGQTLEPERFQPKAGAERHYSRTEQRWEFRILGASAVRTKSVEAYSERSLHTRAHRILPAMMLTPSPRRSRYGIAAIVTAALAAATVGLALPSGNVEKSGSVQIALPPPVDAQEGSERLASAHEKPAILKAAAPPLATAGEDARAVVPHVQQASLAYSLDLEPRSLGPLDERPVVRAAMARAFESDEIQNWSDQGLEGVVVVGPVEELAGRKCRDVAILARDGGPQGETANGRKCLTSEGALVDP